MTNESNREDILQVLIEIRDILRKQRADHRRATARSIASIKKHQADFRRTRQSVMARGIVSLVIFAIAMAVIVFSVFR